MITIQDIDAAVTAREIGEHLRVITSLAYVPVLDQDVPVIIYLDPSCETISQRQLDLLNGLLAVKPERLGEIKTQLYERWGEYDQFYTDEIEFEYDSPDAAFKASQVSSVMLARLGAENAHCPVLRFRVAWDPEHGASILCDQNAFRWGID
jgi:hypothetical protein